VTSTGVGSSKYINGLQLGSLLKRGKELQHAFQSIGLLYGTTRCLAVLVRLIWTSLAEIYPAVTAMLKKARILYRNGGNAGKS
jgi:hypothetical protein